MIVTGTDIETTGIERGDHRIIEFYARTYEWLPGRKPDLIEEVMLRINPERSIQIEAQRVHGISLSDLEHEPKWKDVAHKVKAAFDSTELVIAHNGDGFDLPFINYELERVGLSALNLPSVDTMLQGRWATPQGKVPNLGELCFACDVPYDTSRAHAASYDVEVMMQAFFRAHDWGFFKLPSPLARAA